MGVVSNELIQRIGMRAAVAATIKHNVKDLLRQILAEEVLHAEVVAAGPVRFRTAFVKDMGGFFHNALAECDELANVVFRFAEVKWRDRHPPGANRLPWGTPQETASAWLDAYAPVSPPTEAEIDEAWEIEIGSEDSAMRPDVRRVGAQAQRRVAREQRRSH